MYNSQAYSSKSRKNVKKKQGLKQQIHKMRNEIITIDIRDSPKVV